jgi:hypothetical protein
MAEVACFCGAEFCFDGSAACPGCGTLAALPHVAVPLYHCRAVSDAEINDREGPGNGTVRLMTLELSAAPRRASAPEP